MAVGNSFFIFFKTKANFEAHKEELSSDSIVFIKDTQELYTHETLFPCPYTKAELDTLFEQVGDDLDQAVADLIGQTTDDKSLDTINAAKNYAQDAADAAQSNAATDATTKANQALSDSKSYTDQKIQALDYADNAITYQFVTEVDETDGVISVQRATPQAVGIPVTDADNHFEGTNVEVVLKELYEQTTAGAEVTLEVATTTTEGYLKTYILSQNSTQIGKIDIPKDLVVTEGSVVVGTWSGTTFTETSAGTGKAIKLVVANQTDPLYINVQDLIDVYTGDKGIEISTTNGVSVKLDPTSESFITVSTAGLKISGIQSAIDTVGNVANNIKNTELTHIKDTDTFTKDATKVTLNYDCYKGDQYGATGTTHTADIEGATETNAGVMSAEDKTKLNTVYSYGTTTNRPTDVVTGFSYFDTDLNKVIYWNGTEWVDQWGVNADTLKTGATADRPAIEDVCIGYVYADTEEGILYISNGVEWIQLSNNVMSWVALDEDGNITNIEKLEDNPAWVNLN